VGDVSPVPASFAGALGPMVGVRSSSLWSKSSSSGDMAISALAYTRQPSLGAPGFVSHLLYMLLLTLGVCRAREVSPQHSLRLEAVFATGWSDIRGSRLRGCNCFSVQPQ